MRVISAGPALVITANDHSDEVTDPAEVNSNRKSRAAGAPEVSFDESEAPPQDSGDFRQSSKEGFRHLMDFISKKKLDARKGEVVPSKQTIALRSYVKVAEVTHPEDLTGLLLDKAG